MKEVHPVVWAAEPGNVRTKEDGVLKFNIFAKNNVDIAPVEADQQHEYKLREDERNSQKKKQKTERQLIVEQGRV